MNDRQKLFCSEICYSLFLRNQNNPFLDRVVTFDEKWVFYDTEDDQHSWLMSTNRTLPKRTRSWSCASSVSDKLKRTVLIGYHVFQHFQNTLPGRTFVSLGHTKAAFIEIVPPQAASFLLIESFHQCRVRKSMQIRMVLISRLNPTSMEKVIIVWRPPGPSV